MAYGPLETVGIFVGVTIITLLLLPFAGMAYGKYLDLLMRYMDP